MFLGDRILRRPVCISYPPRMLDENRARPRRRPPCSVVRLPCSVLRHRRAGLQDSRAMFQSKSLLDHIRLSMYGTRPRWDAMPGGKLRAGNSHSYILVRHLRKVCNHPRECLLGTASTAPNMSPPSRKCPLRSCRRHLQVPASVCNTLHGRCPWCSEIHHPCTLGHLATGYRAGRKATSRRNVRQGHIHFVMVDTGSLPEERHGNRSHPCTHLVCMDIRHHRRRMRRDSECRVGKTAKAPYTSPPRRMDHRRFGKWHLPV